MARLVALAGLIGLVFAATGPAPSAEGAGRPALEERILQAAGVETSGPALLVFFRQRTLCEKRLRQLPVLVRQLADSDFQEREQATHALIGLGRAAIPALQEAVKSTDPEVGYRAGRCLVAIAARTDTELTIAAIRVLADRNPPEAVEALLAFLPSAGDGTVEEELAAALAAIGVPDGTPHDAMVEAAHSDRWLLRVAAAGALARSTGEEHRALGRRLLEDPEPKVRWQAARALLAAHDKSAVATLIELVGEGPMPQARLADDLLFRVAGDKAPPVGLADGDADSRRKCRAAWAAWWQANAAAIDLAKLNWKVELDPDLSRLIDYSINLVRESLAAGAADKRAAHKARQAAVMIAFYSQSGPGGAATPLRATLRDAALAVAQSIQAGRNDEALKQLRALPNLNPDRRARTGTVPIIGKHIDFEEVMYYFSARSSGFEKNLMRLQETAKNKILAPAALNDDLLIMATHVGQVAEIAHDFEFDKKRHKEWQKKTDDLRLAARDLTLAVKARQGPEAFTALSRVNNACSNCHDVYR